MKNKIIPLLAISIIALSSCTLFRNYSTEEKEINVYNIDVIDSGDSVDSGFELTIKPRFIQNQPYIPYLTLQQYASLYEPHFIDGVESKFSRMGSSIGWSIYRGEELYFATEINFLTKEVFIAGSLEAAIKSSTYQRDIKSLYYGANTTYDSEVISSTSYATYSFANHKIKYLSYSNNYYISLGFLDMTYSYESSLYYFYNYERIVCSSDVENFSTKQYMVNSKIHSVITEMESKVKDVIMPDYVRSYNGYLFLYFLDNFYGLKDEKNIGDASKYCKRIGVYDSLFSTNPYNRVQAMADALSYLDDNHTALINGSSAWGEGEFTRFRYGEGIKNRSLKNKELTAVRKGVYDNLSLKPGQDVIFSNDGKTAMYVFDGFIFGTSEQTFNEDDSIKTTARLYDSFINLIYFFQDLQDKGGVENVVLDISTNGGGTVGVMMKVLSLISKTGSSHIDYLQKDFNQLISATTLTDINKDEQTTLDDCYGDDFNIFIMTSDCSFSAANAFACYAQQENIAKIIGQKSGGGECAVAIHYLPNGQELYHSSNLHLGFYDQTNKNFIGFESGARPTFEINDSSKMYDIEYLNANITQYI